MPKLTRRESREVAFTLLFEWSFKDETLDEIIENAVETREIVIDSFARELAGKVIENREELDSLIEQYSQGWRLQRISKTALAVLRMSFCELTKFDGIPVGASINEAVELVKKFGTDEEAAYLNGILGNFVKKRKARNMNSGDAEKYEQQAHAQPTDDLTRMISKQAPPAQQKEEAEIIEKLEKDELKEYNKQEHQKPQQVQQVQESQQAHNEVELIEDIIIEVE